MSEGHWFTTRSALFRPGDHVWNEVARYEVPLRNHLERHYSAGRWGLDRADREDLLQGILLEIKERLVETYERSRGGFRTLLRTVVERRVISYARSKRRTPGALPPDLPGDLPDPAESLDDLEAVDFETSLLSSVSECHDHFVESGPHELGVVWVLTDRLVHSLGNKEIAAKRGFSERQVAGRLSRARARIYAALLARELELEPESEALRSAVNVFTACLRQPRRRVRLAEALEPDLAEAFLSFFERFLATLRQFRGSDSVRYQEIARGVLSVFEEAEAGLLESA